MRKGYLPKPRFVLETSQAVFEGGAMRQVMVEAQDGFAVLRLKGLGESYDVPWSTVYRLAAMQAAERELKARRAKFGGEQP